MYCPKCRKEVAVTPPRKGERCPACRTKMWSRKTAYWNLPAWLRVLMCIPLGICMLVVYLSIFNSANMISKEGLVHLPSLLLLVLVYVILAWVKGKVTKGFSKVMLITVLIVAGWVMIFVVFPLFMDGVTWLMNGLFRLLKKAKLLRIYKKGTLANTYELVVLAHAVLLVEALILHFAVRNRFVKPGVKPVLLVAVPLASFWAVYLCAVCDIPKELRKVKIADFVNLWVKRALRVEIITVAAVCLCVLAAAIILLRWAKKQRFTDGDLMAVRKFARVRVVGYWLLKAKLDGMLEHSWESPNEESVAVHTLRVADVSPEKRAAYCAETPQVARILEYLESQTGSKPVGVVDVLRDVQPEHGERTVAGKRAELWYALVKKFAVAAAVVCAALVWLPGFSKYIISTFLGKSADDIMLHVVLFAPVFLIGLGTLINGIARLVWKLSFRKYLLLSNASKLENGNELLRDADRREAPFTDEEITRMLRAYTLRPYGIRDYAGWDQQTAYFFAVLGAVEDMASVAEQ